MNAKAEPAETNAAQAAAIRDLRAAASHLQSALAALSGADGALTAAYVEQALHVCRQELAQYGSD